MKAAEMMPPGIVRGSSFRDPKSRWLPIVMLFAISASVVVSAPLSTVERSSAGAIVFSPNGKFLVSISPNQMSLWDIAAARQIAHLDGQIPRDVRFTPDGKTLVLASLETKIVDVDSGKVTAVHTGKGALFTIFSPDGRAELLKNIKGLSVKTLARPFEDSSGQDTFALPGAESVDGKFYGFSEGAESPAGVFSPDGKTVAVPGMIGGRNQTLLLWDIASQKNFATLAVQGTRSPRIFSPDGKILVVGETEDTRLFDAATGRELGKLGNIRRAMLASFLFSPDSRTLAAHFPAADKRGGASQPAPRPLGLWDPATGKLRATLPNATGFIAFSPDSRTLTSLDTSKGVAQRWDIATEKLLATFTLPPKLATESGKPRLTADGKTTLGPGVLSPAASLSKDGTMIARGFADGTIRVWTIGPDMDPEGKILGTIPKPASSGPELKVSDIPPGTKIVSRGTKVFFQDASGKMTPVPDGNYRMPNMPNYILKVRGGEKVTF